MIQCFLKSKDMWSRIGVILFAMIPYPFLIKLSNEPLPLIFNFTHLFCSNCKDDMTMFAGCRLLVIGLLLYQLRVLEVDITVNSSSNKYFQKFMGFIYLFIFYCFGFSLLYLKCFLSSCPVDLVHDRMKCGWEVLNSYWWGPCDNGTKACSKPKPTPSLTQANNP